MSRYSDIDIMHSRDNAIARRKRIEESRTLEYDKSILYEKDVFQNEKYFENVIMAIKNLINEVDDASYFANNSKTDFNDALILLNELPIYTSLMLEEAEGVKNKIYEASKLVFEEQTALYNEKDLEVGNIITSINENLDNYYYYNTSYVKFRTTNNSLESDDPQKSYYETRMHDFLKIRDNYLDAAESKLSDLTNKISENAELVDLYLKKVL